MINAGSENRKAPLISVIMANYNTPVEYLKEAVESVLRQTMTDFEFIICDDGSTDGSLDYIESIDDERVTVVKNGENRGLAYSRNRQLDMAKGRYVALMDSDDVCEPDRFEKQAAFLDRHPDVIVCASLVRRFENNDLNDYTIRKTSICDMEIFRISLLFNNSTVVHPSVMINRSLLEKDHIRYREEFLTAQDYQMWIDCAAAGKFFIIQEPLLNYRLHNESVSSSKPTSQDRFSKEAIRNQLARLHISLSDEDFLYYPYVFFDYRNYDLRTKALLKRMIKANREYNVYDRKKFEKYLWNMWAKISAFGLKYRKNKLRVLLNVPVSRYKLFAKKIADLYMTEKMSKNANK